jgi:hypothetical protein
MPSSLKLPPEVELVILARHAWMSDERIRLKLKAAGYSRTVTGIHRKLKRMGFKHDGGFYSAYLRAQCRNVISRRELLMLCLME